MAGAARRWLGRGLLGLAVLLGLGWLLLPREPGDLTASFDPRRFGEGVQVYFESIESAYDDIVPGTEKRVIWADGFKEQRTPYALVYLHGFTATSEEIRPVPDRIAEALGANLVYTRLKGHGRPGDAMAEATVPAWMADTAEALAAGRAVGEQVIVLSTSTGGTLAAAAAVDPALSQDVAAMIFVAPNFAPRQAGGALLSWPGVRVWAKWVLGEYTSFAPANEAEGTYWTVSYPTEAYAPLGALVKAVGRLDLGQTRIPALFWYSEDDQVVRPAVTTRRAAEWGGPVETRLVTMGPGDDPASHVVAGDIMSPGQTDTAVTEMLDWLARQGIAPQQ